MPYKQVLYTETIGPATITIMIIAGIHTVRLEDKTAKIEREVMYKPTASHPDQLSIALEAYDRTCEYASKHYGIPRCMPERPDFTKALNI